MAQGPTLGAGSVLAGRYRLEEVIGAGGMATVWRAEDSELGRTVAIKALSETLLADPSYVARFEREAKIAAGLSHPNLVKVFDYGAAEGRPYLVMECVKGPTLAALVAGGERSIDAERLAAELLDALRQIHAAGVVHRDVKPANILVDDTGTAKLTDFGIARPADATQLTMTGQVIGTLAYMAPEVKEGREADQRSDLYSLGVVLRECSKGGSSAALLALVEKLTAAAPKDRPPSAQAATRLLDGGGPAEALEPTVPIATGSRRGPRQALAIGLALAAAAVVVLLVALDSGGGGSKSGGGGRRAAPTAARDASTTEAQPTTPSSNQPATPSPQPRQPRPQPSTQVPCGQVEDQKHALEDQHKAAQEAAGDDKEAKKQVDEAFKAREEQLKAREQVCKEAAKAAAAGGDVPPGHEKSGGEPPGQAKKKG